MSAGAGLLHGCSGVQSSLDPHSSSATLIAALWWGMLAVGTVILVVVTALLLIGVGRSRNGPERPLSQRNAWLLVLAGGVATPAVVILSMVIAGVLIGREIASAPDGGPVVEVSGKLWWWELRYLDDDGEVIATTANEMHIPVDVPVRLRLKSDNVIHSFWAPQLQGKTDLVPGQVNESWVRANRPGIYRGQCSEFCGQQHSFMSFLVVAESPAQFADWLSRQAEPAVEVSEPIAARGRAVFFEVGCAGCHTIRGTPAAGEVGPDLTHLAGRRTLAAATIPNTKGHLGGWISDPQHVNPASQMPPTAMKPADLQALLVYLGSLE